MGDASLWRQCGTRGRRRADWRDRLTLDRSTFTFPRPRQHVFAHRYGRRLCRALPNAALRDSLCHRGTGRRAHGVLRAVSRAYGLARRKHDLRRPGAREVRGRRYCLVCARPPRSWTASAAGCRVWYGRWSFCLVPCPCQDPCSAAAPQPLHTRCRYGPCAVGDSVRAVAGAILRPWHQPDIGGTG